VSTESVIEAAGWCDANQLCTVGVKATSCQRRHVAANTRQATRGNLGKHSIILIQPIRLKASDSEYRRRNSRLVKRIFERKSRSTKPTSAR
jgi:hypothetical protein